MHLHSLYIRNLICHHLGAGWGRGGGLKKTICRRPSRYVRTILHWFAKVDNKLQMMVRANEENKGEWGRKDGKRYVVLSFRKAMMVKETRHPLEERKECRELVFVDI